MNGIKILGLALCIVSTVGLACFGISLLKDDNVVGYVMLTLALIVGTSFAVDGGETPKGFVKNAISFSCLIICFAIVAGLLCAGACLGNLIVEKSHMVTYSWYQPSGGPDMGKWKQGPDMVFLPAIIILFFALVGVAVGIIVSWLLSWLCSRLTKKLFGKKLWEDYYGD